LQTVRWQEMFSVVLENGVWAAAGTVCVMVKGNVFETECLRHIKALEVVKAVRNGREWWKRQ